jgi:hypothetical protein
VNSHLRIICGAIAAVVLAAWMYIRLPSLGIVAFVAIGMLAIGYSIYVLVTKRKIGNNIKLLWKAVFDFFWGI